MSGSCSIYVFFYAIFYFVTKVSCSRRTNIASACSGMYVFLLFLDWSAESSTDKPGFQKVEGKNFSCLYCHSRGNLAACV